MIDRLFAAIRNWFGPERDGRNLARDSRWIVNEMEVSYRAETRERIATITRERLTECVTVLDQDPNRYSQVVGELQRHHREARRGQDMPKWTALTLVIIYLKAQKIGEFGVPARAIIDEFLAQWQHTAEA